MKASVRFFSGTGNTWCIAAAAQQAFGSAGYRTDLDDITRESPPMIGLSAACFCFPVYSLDIPRIARNYLRAMPQAESTVPAIVLVTGGDPDNCGWALPTAAALLAERGFLVRIADLIHMPNNWTPFEETSEPAESERIMGEGVRSAQDAIADFLANKSRIKPLSLKKFGGLASRLMRRLFHQRGVYKLWSLYRVSEACQGCGLCAQLCPTHSIKMVDGKPVWSLACEQCMRCYNYCPNRAITQLERVLHGSKRRAHRVPGFLASGFANTKLTSENS